tara:strand:+ start:9249 stop:10088 length:840 start_codon:yes stop_codon:yes gene_type:complete
MRKNLKLAIARPVGGGYEHPDCGTYVAMTSVDACQLESFDAADHICPQKNRILEARNWIVKKAIDIEADYLLMVDPDMCPDVEHNGPNYRPFFTSSFEFLEQLYAGHHGFPAGTPGVIAAPALSGPPEFKCNVFEPTNVKGGIRRISQSEARDRRGQIERVALIGTGLILIDMKVFEKVKVPWFDDMYKSPLKETVWTTQDSYFCNNCNENGVPVWCNWYSWAAHWKMTRVDRPDDLIIEKTKRNKRFDTLRGLNDITCHRAFTKQQTLVPGQDMGTRR